jgi:hypothetical protein
VTHNAVSTRPNTDLKIILSGGLNCRGYIAMIRTGDHQPGPSINHPVPQCPSAVVSVVAWGKDNPINCASKLSHPGLVQTGHPGLSSERVTLPRLMLSGIENLRPSLLKR